MKFFVDTANLREISEAQSIGVLDGVTTNPTLMAKEGIAGQSNILAHYKDICQIVEGDVSAEVLSLDFETMIREGMSYAEIDEKITVKLPMTLEGIKAIKFFSDRNIKTNCTLVFSPAQAILAAKAGATYVSPFIGRLDDIASSGMELIEKIVGIYHTQGYMTEVLAASIRHPMHVVDCAAAGADVVTCPFGVITSLVKHPLTDKGLAQFMADAEKMK
jgi:transaldolase